MDAHVLPTRLERDLDAVVNGRRVVREDTKVARPLHHVARPGVEVSAQGDGPERHGEQKQERRPNTTRRSSHDGRHLMRAHATCQTKRRYTIGGILADTSAHRSTKTCRVEAETRDARLPHFEDSRRVLDCRFRPAPKEGG